MTFNLEDAPPLVVFDKVGPSLDPDDTASAFTFVEAAPGLSSPAVSGSIGSTSIGSGTSSSKCDKGRFSGNLIDFASSTSRAISLNLAARSREMSVYCVWIDLCSAILDRSWLIRLRVNGLYSYLSRCGV